MPYLPLFLSICTCFINHQLFCTDVVICSYTTVPVAFRLAFMCMFTKLEVQERRSLASQGTLTSAVVITRTISAISHINNNNIAHKVIPF